MKAVKVRTDGSIALPREMRRSFPAASSMAVWTEGDLIILKRLKPAKPSEIALRRPGRAMPLSRITAEIHRARQERRRRRV
jgi:hypothetical protein